MESNLICNIIDWDTTDTDNKFIIHAYGVDDNGTSVGLRIINFLPEYFVKIYNKDDDNQNDIMKYFDDNLDIILDNLEILSRKHLYCKNENENKNENGNNCHCLKCVPIDLLEINESEKEYYNKQYFTNKGLNINRDETYIVEKKDLYDGFNWDKKNKTSSLYYPFLKIAFNNIKSFHKIKSNLQKRLYDPKQEQKVFNKFVSLQDKYLCDHSICINFYETKMPPLLRFFHKQNILPAGWITIDYDNLNDISDEDYFNCNLSYEVEWKDINNYDRLDIGNIKILSWDIEADSEYGDFPQPIKEYHKQASEIADYYLYRIKKKIDIDNDDILLILKKMFNKLENDIDISKLNNINQIYFRKEFYNMYNEKNILKFLKLYKKIFEICEKYKSGLQKHDIKLFKINIKQKSLKPTILNQNQSNSTNTEIDSDFDEDFDEDIEQQNRDCENELDYEIINNEENNIKTNRDIIIYKINDLFSKKIGLYVRGDRITQIGAVFQTYGNNNYDKFIITLGSCETFDDSCIIINTKNKSFETIINESLKYDYNYTKIISFYDKETYDNYDNVTLDCLEIGVILTYKELIVQYNPDIILAYNNFGFDNKFIMKRIEELNIKNRFSKISKLVDHEARLFEKNLSSAALGDNILQLIENKGRVHIDLLKVVQRDFKLDSYKLDSVAEHFLGEHKDDVSVNQIFEYQKLDGKHRAIIAKYCVQDCVLLLNLISKLSICSNNIGMANVCYIPLSFIFLRGQGIKIQSLVGKFCMEKDVLLKTLLPNNSDASYEGAVVLEPIIGMYLGNEDQIPVLDYASLYPSAMIGSNISHDTKVQSIMTEYKTLNEIINLDFSDMRQPIIFQNLEKYLLKKYSTEETKQLLIDIPKRYQRYPLLDSIYIPEIKKRYIRYKNIYKLYKQTRDNPSNNENLNIKNFDYIDIYFDTYRGKADKKYKTGIKRVTYALNNDEQKGILPQILQTLLAQRKAVRKQIPFEKEPFKKDILEGYQLAYKLCANSLYGQTGSSTSVISDIDLASSTTATGRQMLSLCKSFGEQYYNANVIYGDSVVGDEPLILRNNKGIIEIKTIETLSNEWESYENFKPFDTITSNRRDKQKAYVNYEVFANNKWNLIKKVIRHKTNKKIYKINTSCGIVDVTEDHSLLNENAEKIKPSNCIINKTKLLYSFPKHFVEFDTYYSYQNEIHFTNEDTAKIYSVFMKYGYYNSNKWYIKHDNLNTITKYKTLFETIENITMEIISHKDKYILNPINFKKKLFNKYYDLFYNNKNNIKNIPSIILNSNYNIRKSFLNIYDIDKNKFKLYFDNKLVTQTFYYLIKSVYNIELYINYEANEYIITNINNINLNISLNTINSISYLKHSDNDYVYDLETENGNFNAGIGEITVANTDSIFCRYNNTVYNSNNNNENNLLELLNEHLENPINLINEDKLTTEIKELIENMNKVEDKMNLKISILRSIILSNEIAQLLRPPHDLEYEKTFSPFILFSKKRYIGTLYELDAGYGKLKYMGIVLKRRDNANIVKIIYKGIIEKIMNEQNIQKSINYLQNCLSDLLEGKYSIEDLTITKTLRASYKNREIIAHAVLADRIGKRTGEKVSSNTRIPYVYIEIPEKKGVKILQGNRIELPEYALKNNLNIDYEYYITNQLMKPILQIYNLVMKEPIKIFTDILRISNNRKNNNTEIINWFKPINKNANLKTKIKIEKGCVFIIQKSKSVSVKCNKDCINNSNFCKSHFTK